uniref:Uncharacterized protein n=1 Tax=Oryza brachyantha TaxID=4533 RepID=J3KWE7_ORYBR
MATANVARLRRRRFDGFRATAIRWWPREISRALTPPNAGRGRQASAEKAPQQRKMEAWARRAQGEGEGAGAMAVARSRRQQTPSCRLLTSE